MFVITNLEIREQLFKIVVGYVLLIKSCVCEINHKFVSLTDPNSNRYD